MKKRAIWLLSAALALPISAGGVTLLSADIPPYSINEQNHEGICIDIARALFQRAGIDLEVEYHPWARSQSMARSLENYVITPLTRTPEREAHYDWIVPIFSYQLQLITNDSTIPIEDLEAMRNEEICVLRESPAEYKLKALGFEKRLIVTKEEKCMQMLALKRAKAALIHGILNARYGYKKYGYNADGLLQGLAFPSGDIYIGSSKSALTTEQRHRLNQALDAIKAEGIYDRIIEKYR